MVFAPRYNVHRRGLFLMYMSSPNHDVETGHVTYPELLWTLRQTADDFLCNNWSILPLFGKRPALASWKEFQVRLPTTEEIDYWFSPSRDDVTGIGIVTGRFSGLVVVDCDSPADAQYWRENFPQSPLVAFTGGGGSHFYYAAPASLEIRNRTGLFGRRIDIRGDGGYATAPPSRHPTGTSYRWTQRDSANLPAFDPAWLADPIGAVSLPATPGALNCRNVNAYIQRIRAVSGQGGHNATFRVACRLREAGLSPTEALALLSHWNKTNAAPPWSAAELAHKIRSAYQSLPRRDDSVKLF